MVGINDRLMAKAAIKNKWSFRKQLLTLYYALKDDRMPWYAKVTAISSILYLFSPVDFLPDVIPVAGYLDDLFVVPFLVNIATKLLPADVRILAEQRARARGKRTIWWIIIVLLLMAAVIAFFVFRRPDNW